MFMNIDCEVSTEEIMKQLLNAHSLNYVLWLALKTYNYHSPEYIADMVTKIVEETNE